ncbi:hypothetical protein ROA7450_01520 [Roseovarius albus]|uniref:Uncharacterized protein n=1 Tax=Roseovarius albus TaxID=1247867 RepID=A0A1X6YXG6_9RHOB|nr:hypothetical protein ROA7450_01520 [Roseovarius albus]
MAGRSNADHYGHRAKSLFLGGVHLKVAEASRCELLVLMLVGAAK